MPDGDHHLGPAAFGVVDCRGFRNGERVGLSVHHRETGPFAALVAGDDLAVHLQRLAGHGCPVAEVIGAAAGRKLYLLAGGDNFLHGVRPFRVDDHERRFLEHPSVDADLRHVVGDAGLLGELGNNRRFAVEHLHGQTVRLRTEQMVQRSRATAAGLVFDDHGSTCSFREMRRQHPRIKIVAAAGSIANEKVDRRALEKIALRRVCRCRRHQRGQTGQQSRGQCQSSWMRRRRRDASHGFPPVPVPLP